MGMFRSSNPVLGNKDAWAAPAAGGNVMTVQGAVTKTIFVLGLTMASAGFVWSRFFAGEDVTPFLVAGAIASLIAYVIMFFSRSAGPITTSVYAIGEGLSVGAISAFVEVRYPKLPIQAVALTFGTLFALLAAYKARIIQATNGLRTGIIAATCGIALVYLVDLVVNMFGGHVPFIHESGPIGIAFSVFVVGIAALNLVLDFDYIERGAAYGASKKSEWWAAFGLLLTLVWLYLEILNLLMKLQDNRGRRSGGGISS